MSHAHDAALAFLLASNVQERAAALKEEMTVTVSVSMTPKASKKVAAKKEPAPIHPKGTPMVGMMLPDRGTMNAKEFLLAMRNAGRRVNPETHASYIDQREVRNDQIRAIHAFMYQVTREGRVYVGYDPKGEFGSQDVAARMLAQRELRGAPSTTTPHTAPSRTLAGYVHGMPDHKARALANLQGQEAREVDAKIAHLRDASDMSRSAAERTLSEGLVAIQDEKLAHIRAEMARLVG